MANVEFPEEQYNRGTEFEAPKTPTMVKWVMKTGLVKDERQANIVLVGIAILFFALTWWVLAGGSKTPSGQTISPEERAALMQERSSGINR